MEICYIQQVVSLFLDVILRGTIDRTDDQRGGVSAPLIRGGAEEWEEPLSEAAASKGMDKTGSIYIIK